MKQAFIQLSRSAHYRCDAFESGFKRHGFETVIGGTLTPEEGDVLLIWNRYGEGERSARAFEEAGQKVIVAENSYLGKYIRGIQWYALSINHHNGAGSWPDGDSSRLHLLGQELLPFRHSGSELVILPQRSIGEPGVAMPRGWADAASSKLPGRVRPHPGIRPCKALEEDLENAYAVYTWGSGAAIKALVAGIPVYYDMPNWIGATAGALPGSQLNRDEEKRFKMFQKLSWAQWSVNEISSGLPWEYLL